MACSQYQADVLAAEFGQCKCGYPKQAHISEGENKAAAALRALRSSERDPSLMVCGPCSKPCSNYTVDVGATTFGQCLCGHPKEAHISKVENKAATERAKLSVKEQEALRLSTRTANMLEPCSEFKLDTKAETFGTCLCGHPQSAHKTTTINPAEAALLALKAKNSEKAASREEEADPKEEDPKEEDAEEENPNGDNEVVTRNSCEPVGIPTRHDFGWGVSTCSVCRSFCRNRGCKDTAKTVCHTCWPEYVRSRSRNS
jgi:hypothetical protein